jgi:hypothetical protein
MARSQSTQLTDIDLCGFPGNQVTLEKRAPETLLRVVQRMRHTLEVYFAHTGVVAQEALSNFLVDAQHPCDFV